MPDQDDDEVDAAGLARLAAAVLARAVEHEGVRYLDCTDFAFWCTVAGADPAVMRTAWRRRLAMRPDTVTEADVDLLGQIRLSLDIRAAVAYELTRALRTTKTAAKSSRRRTR